jgi:hypothetical protein
VVRIISGAIGRTGLLAAAIPMLEMISISCTFFAHNPVHWVEP